MKKLAVMTAMGIGFILGSRAGRRPYEQVEGQLRKLAGRPEVKKSVDTVSSAVSDRVDDLTDTVASKIPQPAGSNSGPGS